MIIVIILLILGLTILLSDDGYAELMKNPVDDEVVDSMNDTRIKRKATKSDYRRFR